VNIFGGLDKTLKEGRERWAKIEALAEELKTNPDATKLAEAIVMIVEHLKPLYSYDVKPEDFNLENILKGLKKK
jgi:hypothetical protein